MRCDFDEIIDRKQNYAAKIEEAHLHYGTNDVIPLWIADMDFPTARPIIDAIKARATQGIFGYTYRPDAYFQVAADWQRERNGHTHDTAKMAFAPGIIPGMRIFLNLFTAPGDKILIQQPVYHPFEDIARNTGRALVVNELVRDENGFYTMNLEDFERKAASGVKYFILCNPHNPVGRVWTKAELRGVGDICAAYGIGILSDEIHSDLMLGESKHTVTASVSPAIGALTTTFIGASKTF
ncbi:MAG: aminotransferase class I/II-fold pyridoxal phosphate-dependent enzyme, partial [Peptococcaceae bacterium]|nr:aminotransferase class I/II-fold pyridoxal phosphate-dependent enzyme [Peptococcaceae bacterium]